VKNEAIEALRALVEMPLISDRKKAFEEWQGKYVVVGEMTLTLDKSDLSYLRDPQTVRRIRLCEAADALVADIPKDPTLLALEGRDLPDREIAQLGVCLLRFKQPPTVELQRTADGKVMLAVVPDEPVQGGE
jgi:hypothetical protein